MEFVIEKVLPNGLGRVGVIKTAHGEIKTPAFMAVGTRGYVRFISADDLHELGAQAMLSNGYHLRRQAAKIAKAGGLAEWKPLSFDQPFPFTEPAASRPVVTGETCFNRSPLVAKSSLEKLSPFPDSAKDIPVITLGAEQLSKAWKAEKVDDKFVVTGPKIEKFARRTDLGNYASVNRLRDIMKKMGIRAELTSLGAQPESIISIAGKEFTLVEDY